MVKRFCIFLAAAALATAFALVPVDARAENTSHLKAVKRICDNSFAKGELASIKVFASTGGKNNIYALFPDPMLFSDAPVTYFDSRGKELLIVPQFPVTGAAKEQPILEKQKKLLRGLEEAETIFCAKIGK